MKKLVLSLSFAILSFFARAQEDDKIKGDRPDQTDGTDLLKKGELQIEQEFYYNHFRNSGPAIISSSLLRYGLLGHIETRLLIEDGKERDKFIDKTTQGLYPLAFSMKAKLLEGHKTVPDITIITYVNLPLTSKTGQDKYWSPCFLLALEKEYGKITVTTNTGIKWGPFDKDYSWQATTDVKYEISKHVEVYAEYFAHYKPGDSPLHNGDVGGLYHLSKQWMLSLAVGRTLFEEDHNYFFTAGIAFRLPHKTHAS